MTHLIDRAANPARKIKWYWYAGGGVIGYGVYRWYENQQAASAAADQAAADATQNGDQTDYSSDYASEYGTDNGYAPVYGVSPTQFNPDAPAPIVTNAQWFDAAVAYDTQNGFPVRIATVALTKYLENRATALTEQEYNAVEAAIVRLGPPPVAVRSPQEKPPAKPPKGGGKKPHRDVTYTTRKGDTLRIVSQRFYGNITHIQQIKNANRKVLHDKVGPFTRLQPGILLEIPAATRGF